MTQGKLSLYVTTGFLVFLAIIVNCLISLWTERNLEWFLGYLKGSPVDIPYWLAFLITLALNAVIFVLNVIAELARFAI